MRGSTRFLLGRTPDKLGWVADDLTSRAAKEIKQHFYVPKCFVHDFAAFGRYAERCNKSTDYYGYHGFFIDSSHGVTLYDASPVFSANERHMSLLNVAILLV
jgi:dTDP-4-dehydrorhamnose 3,5-epimerase-like enzyme